VPVGKPERIKVSSRSNPLALPWTKIINSFIGFEAGIWVVFIALLKNPDSRLFKKVQMRGARRIDEAYTDTLERGD
jgi:hypothetical protein